MEHEIWARAARYAGCSLHDFQIEKLSRYRDWLVDEAIPAGAVGRGEGERIDSRHIGDSLLFWVGLDPEPEMIWDLGSGAGLPGIPLAITAPDTEVLLIERSGRRVDLLDRAVRILGLDNCRVVHTDIAGLRGTTPALVARALRPPARLTPLADRHLATPGTAVVGGSWTGMPQVEGWETHQVPEEILDHPVWLLIMRRR